MTSSDSEREGGPDAEHPTTDPDPVTDPDPTSDPHPATDPPGPTPAGAQAAPEPLDIDTAFAAIIAGWADDAPAATRWPDQENLVVGRHRRDDAPAGRPDPEDQGTDALVAAGPARSPLIPPLGDEEPAAEPDDYDTFVPPEPPPLPRGDVISRLAWAGVLGGPAFLLVAVMVWQEAPQLLVLTSLGAFVAGFVTLIARMPTHRSDDDDDGAVV